MGALIRRLRYLLRLGGAEADLMEELEIHRAMRQAALERNGLSPADAAAASRRALGNLALAREDARAVWQGRAAGSLWRDLRYAVRILRRNAGFTCIAIVTLALGIGATTALFSVADEVLFRPLAVTDPGHLVLFRWTSGPRGTMAGTIAGMNVDPVTGEGSSTAFSALTFQRFRAESRTLSDVFAFADGIRSVDMNSADESASGQAVSGNYFSALGVRPALGRLITPADDRPEANPVAVISHRYWGQRFDRDPAALGQSIPLDTSTATIIGVLPSDFTGTTQLGNVPDFSIPLALSPRIGRSGTKITNRMDQPWVWGLRLMGRVRPSLTYADVRRDLQAVLEATAVEGYVSNPRTKPAGARPDVPVLHVENGARGLTERRFALTRALMIFATVSGLLLLIVCVNLVNLLLARIETRRREMAVRLAIGASRWRLMRQLLTETMLVTIGGAALGGVVAWWSKDLFLLWLTRTNASLVIEPRIDLRVLGFTILLSFATALLVGLIPGLRATRVDPLPSLQETSGTTASGRPVAGRVLVVSQVAISLVLVIVAGLFLRTLHNLQTTDLGFSAENLLLLEVGSPKIARSALGLPPSTYAQFVERVRAIPGVRSVAWSQVPLVGGDLAMPYLTVPGKPKDVGEDRTVFYEGVSVGFFETLAMPIARGRSFQSSDVNRPVALVNETLARRFFDGEAIGRRIGVTKDASAPALPEKELLEIVGVVRDAKYMTVREASMPTVFVSGMQLPRGGTMAVRTGVAPLSLVPSIRRAAAEVNRDLVVSDFRSQAEQVQLTFAEERHLAVLSSLFGVLALLLTSSGVYGLLSYGVARRTQEIGIRMALGAERRHVIRSVLLENCLLVGLGATAGAAAATVITRLVESMLFGLAGRDPATIAASVALMLTVALLAGLPPAFRAARVDPLVALREG